jgi:nitrate/nitrite-specific signal transduction histidine kinase
MQQARRFVNPKGQEELAITAPVYNEPECANAACHVHPAEQKVLGTLDISLSQEQFRKSLATMKLQMLIFTLMTLILTVGGVSALLRRSVFMPIGELNEFAEQIDNGKLPDKPEALPEELDRLATSLYNMGAETRRNDNEKTNNK